MIRARLLNMLMPITKWIGSTHAPYSRKKMLGEFYYMMRDGLQPGDILLSRTDGELSNVLIPGFWKHLGLYVGDREGVREAVVEAIGKGVTATPLASFAMQKDYICVLRSTIAAESERSQVADWVWSKIGSPYDFAFASSTEAFYCAELGHSGYKIFCPKFEMPLLPRLGALTVTPDDFSQEKGLWEPLLDTRWEA